MQSLFWSYFVFTSNKFCFLDSFSLWFNFCTCTRYTICWGTFQIQKLLIKNSNNSKITLLWPYLVKNKFCRLFELWLQIGGWFLLAHLSQRLKWAFLINICPSLSSSLLLTFHIFIFFFRTTGPISTKLDTKHLWVKGIQVYSNEGPCSFPRGDNDK